MIGTPGRARTRASAQAVATACWPCSSCSVRRAAVTSRRAHGRARRLGGDRPPRPGRARGPGPAGPHPRRGARVRERSRAEVPVAAARLAVPGGQAAHRPACRGPACPTAPTRSRSAGGTTTAEVAKALAGRPELAIVTNSLTTAMEIASRPQPQGHHDRRRGALRSPSRRSGPSPRTPSTRSTSAPRSSAPTASARRAARRRTTRSRRAPTTRWCATRSGSIVVADGSKVGRVTLAKMADLSQIHVLVTDSDCRPRRARRASGQPASRC